MSPRVRVPEGRVARIRVERSGRLSRESVVRWLDARRVRRSHIRRNTSQLAQRPVLGTFIVWEGARHGASDCLWRHETADCRGRFLTQSGIPCLSFARAVPACYLCG
jgi:hypothetical protein